MNRFTDDQENVISIRKLEVFAIIMLKGNISTNIISKPEFSNKKSNRTMFEILYCLSKSLYQQVYFHSTSTQCQKLPRRSFGLIQSTSSPLPLNVKSSQLGAFDLSSCYLLLDFSSITLIITREGIISIYLHSLNITI